MSLLRARAVRARPRALVLLDPQGAFASVARRPLWGLAVVVMLTSAALPAALYGARVDAPALVRKELRASGRAEQLPPQELDRVVERGAAAVVWFLPVSAAVKRSLWMTFLSFVLLGVVRGARPGVALSPVAGAVGLGAAPLALRDVIGAASLALTDARTLVELDPSKLVLSNPATWLGLDTRHSAWGVALSGLDLFELWSCGLVAVGVVAVSGARTRVPFAVTFGVHAALVSFEALRSHVMPH